MTDMVVAYLGWNSSSQGWNGGTWGNNVALPGSTASVGAVTVVGTAVQPVTGLTSTASVGAVTVTGTASVAVTGIAATGSPGAVTVIGMANVAVTGVAGTGQVGDVSTLVVGNANVDVTGLFATASVTPTQVLVWSDIVPSQNPSYNPITPPSTSSWSQVALQEFKMASTYVNNLRLEEIGTGEQSGTWGDTTNTNMEIIGQAVAWGTRAIANASTDNITIADGALDADRCLGLKLTGGGQACTVTLLPNTSSKTWFMYNATAAALTFTCGSGANVIIPAGQTKVIATDGLGSGGVVHDLLTAVNLAGTTVVDDLTVSDDLTVTDDLIVGGVSSFADGSTSAPSITNTGDLNTGISFPAADSIAFSTAGTQRTLINADGFYDYAGTANDVARFSGPNSGSITIRNDTANQLILHTGTSDALVLGTGGNNDRLTIDAAGAATFSGTLGVTGVLTTTAATVFNGGFASNAASTISTADNSAQLKLISTDADANSGPVQVFYRNSGSPADSDLLGEIHFRGRNDNSQDVEYVTISTRMEDVSDGTEDGKIILKTMVAGTARSRIEIDHNDVVINQDSIDSNLRVESNGDANMLFVDGGRDKVFIGASGSDNDAVLLVQGDDVLHPVLKLGGASTNGFTLLSDSYQTDESTMNIGSSYSSSSLVLARGVKVSGSADNTYLSSQDTFADTPAALRISSAGFKFLSAASNATTATDSAVTLVERLSVSPTEMVVNDASVNMDFRVESDGNTHMLFVDASTDRVGIGAGASPASTLHVADTTEDPYVLVDGSAGNRDSGYKINGGGGVKNAIRGDSGGTLYYGNESQMSLTSGAVVFNEASSDIDFRVESNANANAFLVDAGNELVKHSITTQLYNGSAGNSPSLVFGSETNAAQKSIFLESFYMIQQIHVNEGMKIRFTDGTNTTDRILFQSSQVVFNETGADTDFRVESNGNTHMLFVDGGANSVAIGNATASYAFHVNENRSGNYVAGITNDGNNVNRYGMIFKLGTDDGSGTNTYIAFDDGDGSGVGAITGSGGTITYATFTAVHPAILPDADNENGYAYGTLLDTTEITYSKRKNGQETERGIRYKVVKSASANSRTVLGAYAGKDPKYDNEHLINVLGDGHILCNNSGGNIAVGDGVCTSATAGIGQKATASPSMIIGIAQEAVTFSNSTETKLVPVQYGLQQFTPWS